MSNTISFILSKATGTHGDVFAAVGLADLLSTASNVGQVQIKESPAAFEIQPVLKSDGIRSIAQSPGYPFLKANEKVAIPKGVMD